MADQPGQAGEYRGVILPDGMTPNCLDGLASLFNDFSDGLLKVGTEEATPAQAAVMAFELVIQGRPAGQTGFSQSLQNGGPQS